MSSYERHAQAPPSEQEWLEREEQADRRQADADARYDNYGEFHDVEDRRSLWDDYQENYVEMTEFRLPPARAERMQMELNFGEVA